jgi:hypothetical protein
MRLKLADCQFTQDECAKLVAAVQAEGCISGKLRPENTTSSSRLMMQPERAQLPIPSPPP